jgi:5'-3' exonuclease
MKTILLIDGNSIAHANHNGTVLTVGDFQVQAIFGFLKSLRALMGIMPAETELIVLWDGKAQFRCDIYPDYKLNREALDPKDQAHKDAFKRQTPFIEKALELLGVTQVRSPFKEADDLASHWVKTWAANPELTRRQKIILVSGDKDWLQLVQPGVEWFDPIRDRWCRTDKFLDFTGYHTPSAFVHGKALQGDNSDNVTGIPGIGEGTARIFMAKWLDVNRFFKAVDDGSYTPAERKSKTAKSLHPEQLLACPEGRATFQRNLRLMDLSSAPDIARGELIVKRSEPNPEGFRRLCERLNFASILREQATFMSAIKRRPLPMAA